MFDHNNPNSQNNIPTNVNGEYHFVNPYMRPDQRQQSYTPPVQNDFLVPGKPPKAPKEKKKSFLTRKSAALLLAFCILASAGMGIGGGMLGYQLSRDNTPVSTASTDTANVQQMSNQTATPEGELTVEQIAAKAADSVVEITTEGVSTDSAMRQVITQGAGSGVILTEDGKIVTNNHVIDGASKITVTLRSGESYDATLIGTDAETDVALLKINATGLTPAEIGDSDSLQVGETAVAIGNPLGQLGGTVTNGIISALDRDITLEDQTMTLLQTNAAINPGNSGGGLFNGQGQLIGVVVAKSSGENVEGLGFAIPVNKVQKVVEQLSEYGYVKGRVALGVSLVDITTEQQALMYQVPQLGVYIWQVTEGGSAQEAGLQQGDCIQAIDGAKVSTATEVKEILQQHQVGDTIAVQVLRNGQTGTVNVTLKESVPTSVTQNTDNSNTNNGGGLFGGFGSNQNGNSFGF